MSAAAPPRRIHATALIALLVCLCALFRAAPAPAADGPDKVSVQLLWVDQAQFTGFYVAKDQGIYEKHGLDVTIVPGGPGVSPLKTLLSGASDFACAWLADAIETRAKGGPVVNLAQLVQHSALLLVAHSDTGIDKVEDLNGGRVSMWDDHFALAPRTLLSRRGIKYREIRQGAGMALLMDRAVTASSAMRYNELHQLYQSGLDPDELVIFDFADLGLNLPEDGLYTTQALWENNPDLCRRFTRATLEGWRLAFEKPNMALASVMRRVNQANLASNRPHQLWMLTTMKDLMTNGLKPDELGRLSPKTVLEVEQALLEERIIRRVFAPGELLTDAWQVRP